MERFWDFVVLRQAAYWRKQRGEGPPYSEDAAIARYHFCNVYREADRGTVYFQEHRNGTSQRELLFQAVAYRLLNRVATFGAWGGLPIRAQWEEFLRYVDSVRAGGAKVFTGRHLNVGFEGYARALEAAATERGDKVARDVFANHTLEGVTRALLELPEVGRFFAWQLACDLLESGALEVTDADDWALLGPGAVKGAQLVDLESNALDTARDLVKCQPSPDILVPPPQAPGPFSLKNVEHALCEYARYARATDTTVKAKGLEVKPWAK